MLTETDPTVRFTDRADYYAAYRPGYPDSVVGILRRDAGLAGTALVVDAGSGTGLSSELFLRHGYTVCGVEPNPAMRHAAEQLLRHYPEFHSVDGRAELTTLPDASADLIVCASAFHWFDAQAARIEFRRLLRPHGFVALLGNGRANDASDFMRAYAALYKKYGRRVREHQNRAENVRVLFGDNSPCVATARWRETVDFRVLSGRTLSYSTVPLPGEPGHGELMRDLRLLFDGEAEDGRVWYEGEVKIQWGRLP